MQSSHIKEEETPLQTHEPGVESTPAGDPDQGPPLGDPASNESIYEWIRPGGIGFGPTQPVGLTRSPPSRPISVDRLPDAPHAAPEILYNSIEADEVGPVPEDIQLCDLLLEHESPVPQDTMFDENNIAAFETSLWGSSATRLLVDLHPLLFPSAETQFIRGRRCLEHISDAYNDPWNKIQPNYEPLPQPSHTRGLLQSLFDSAQRCKLEIWPQRKSVYKARENLLFPYLIAEVIGQPERLENADQKVKYDVPIAVFGLVSLAQKARRMESLHRRILAFSLSHNHEIVSLHGYYLVIDGETFTYWRRLIKQFKIWTVETKWLCYRFVHNLDEYFLPRHIRRIMDMLEHIPEPPSIDFTEEYWLNNPPIDLIQCGLANTQLMEANRTWLAQTAGKDRNQRIME